MTKQPEDQQYDDEFLEIVRREMQRPGVRRLVWHILDQCGIYSDCFTGNSTTFMLIGQQRIGLGILHILESADPKIYPKMLMESIEQKEAKKS